MASPESKPVEESASTRKRVGARDRAASPGVAATGDDAVVGARKATDDLQKKKSVYSLDPHKQWLWNNGNNLLFTFFGMLAFMFLAMCCLLTPNFKTLRLAYTVVASSLLLYRFQYYAQKQWLFFFIDLCYVVSFLLIASLWICPDGGCSSEWQLAVNIVAQGAVAGATFPLQMPLLLHHPEAFETFFLHNSPMWVCYAIRWRFFHLASSPGLRELVWLGFSKVYLPWVLCYWTFLMLQPFMPDFIAGAEVLPDGFVFPGATRDERLKGKRNDYMSWVKKASAGLVAHMLLSVSGFLAAAMTYQYHCVQVAWIFSVLAGCADTAYVFYRRSADPTIPAQGIQKGLARMVAAWAFIGPLYVACRWYGVAYA